MSRTPLNAFCALTMGQSPDSESYNIEHNGFPFYQGNADFGRIHPMVRVWCSAPKKLAKAGDILISVRAPIGALNIADCDCCIGRGLAAITPDATCADTMFLFYALYASAAELQRRGTGSTFKAISKNALSNLLLPSYCLEEQKEISAVLQQVDHLISLRQRQAEKLDELVKARFVEMFGDPVLNCLHTAARPMTEICQIIDGDRGKNYPKADDFFDKGDCLFLNAKNVTKAGFNFDECMFITKDKDNVLRKGKLQRGDIILTTRGTIGNLAFYTDDVPYSDIRINSGMVILRMNREYINPIYFIEQFKMQLENIKRKIASGTAQPQLPISTMNKIKIIIPDIRLQANFANFVHEVDREKERIQRSAALLETLKRSLMQQYFG